MKVNRLYPREILYTVSSWFSILLPSLCSKNRPSLYSSFSLEQRASKFDLIYERRRRKEKGGLALPPTDVWLIRCRERDTKIGAKKPMLGSTFNAVNGVRRLACIITVYRPRFSERKKKKAEEEKKKKKKNLC